MLTATPKSSAMLEAERLGFAYHEESQFDLDLLSPDRRVQVREVEHYAPQASVAQYAVQMGQTAFPPIIVTRNNWLVDGNTRVGAKLMRKEKYSAAVILDVEYGKNDKADTRIYALAATLNQTGGQRLTPAEAKAAAKRILSVESWKPEQVSRAVGIKGAVVTQVKRELAAEKKIEKVGFTEIKKLSPVILRALGGDPVTSLNDVPYKNLCDLAVDANLGSTEISAIAKELKATGSDAGMIAHVGKKRAEMAERIKEHSLLGNGKPAPSSLLRRSLGMVTKYEATPSALVEHAPAVMLEHKEVLCKSIEILQAVYQLQVEAIDA